MGVTSAWDAAVIARLKADAPLVAATVGIYAGTGPQAADSGDAAAFPYVVLGPVNFLDYHTASESGWEVFTRVYTLSRSPGRKETRDIQDLIEAALHRRHGSMSVAGYSVLLIDREGSVVEDALDEDGSWRGVCDFRAVVTRDAAD